MKKVNWSKSKARKYLKDHDVNERQIVDIIIKAEKYADDKKSVVNPGLTRKQVVDIFAKGFKCDGKDMDFKTETGRTVGSLVAQNILWEFGELLEE